MTRAPHRRAYGAIILLVTAGLGIAAYAVGWRNVLATPDQRGAWNMREAHYDRAAGAFRDPMWRAVATFRAGDFKGAAAILSGIDTADAAYDHGNALVMLGQYEEAVKRYDRAIALRPGWSDAEANRTLARLRAERLKTTGGDTGNTDSQPDQVVFDATKPKDDAARDDPGAGGPPMSDEAARALWLRGVQTKPADFLRAKFAYQLQIGTPDPASGGKAP